MSCRESMQTDPSSAQSAFDVHIASMQRCAPNNPSQRQTWPAGQSASPLQP
jgi:hypothetical protein